MTWKELNALPGINLRAHTCVALERGSGSPSARRFLIRRARVMGRPFVTVETVVGRAAELPHLPSAADGPLGVLALTEDCILLRHALALDTATAAGLELVMRALARQADALLHFPYAPAAGAPVFAHYAA